MVEAEKQEKSKRDASGTRFIAPPTKPKKPTTGNAIVRGTSMRQVSMKTPSGGGISKSASTGGLFKKAIMGAKSKRYTGNRPVLVVVL